MLMTSLPYELAKVWLVSYSGIFPTILSRLHNTPNDKVIRKKKKRTESMRKRKLLQS